MKNAEEIAKAVAEAAVTISKELPPTPLLLSEKLSARLRCKVLLKMECQQPTGSFKIRGAINKYHQAVASLGGDPSAVTFVAASSGNHALACCHCWSLHGCEGRIFLPASVSSAKEAKLRALGFPLVKVPGQCLDSELAARRFSEEAPKRVLMPPYNDWDVMTGNGSFASEMLSQAEASGDRLDAVIMSVGGGGLIGGAAGFLKARAPHVRVIGVQPQNDPVMGRSVEQGRIMTSEELGTTDTIAEGVAGGLEEGTLTFPICCSFVDEWVMCSEAEIARCTLELLETEAIRVEAAAGLTLAALRKCLPNLQGRTVALCLCGANVCDEQFVEYDLLASKKCP